MTSKNAAFFRFHYGVRSSCSTAVLLTVVSDRIVWVFNRSGATRLVTFHIFKTFARIWHVSLSHRPRIIEHQVGIFGTILPFLSNRRQQGFG